MEQDREISRIEHASAIDDYLKQCLIDAESFKTIDLFFELSRNFICVVGVDGYFKRLSKSFVDALGYTEEKLFSVPAAEFVVKQVKREHGCYAYYFDNYYCCKNDRVIKIAWRIIPNISGEAVFMIGWDITNR